MSILLIALLGFLAIARAAVAPFTVQGALDSASADTQDYNTGGRISVNGLSIVIPKNLQFQFPASWVPFKRVAGGGFNGMEVSVTGNYVDGVATAGLVQLSQFLLEGSTGTIGSLAYDGKITLTTGQVLRINDPNAAYSAGYTLRPEFTADDENPSITSFGGYPMCVPRSAIDADCPEKNRPQGQTNFVAAENTKMAPLKVGDYIEYSGVRVGGETIVYSLVANLQILTKDVAPFIRVEEAIIGVVDGQPTGGIELADTRFVGFTTDNSVSVIISRIDVSPCDGSETLTSVGSATIKATDARNKWTWRASASTKVKYARDYLVTTSRGTRKIYGDKITVGQYVQSVTEWIFPESTVPGAVLAPNDFSQMGHLVDGFGPDEDGNVWGPLRPWPNNPVPAANTNCPAPGTPAPQPPPTTPATDTVTIDSYTWTNQNGGTISVTARSSDVNAVLKLQLMNPTAGPELAMVSAGAGKFTYSARSTKQPSQGITVTSTLKGKASRTTLTTRRRRRSLGKDSTTFGF